MPDQSQDPPQSRIFLIGLLSMTCLNLLSSNLLNNAIRSNMAYWFNFLKLSSSSEDTMSNLASYLNLATILLGTISGYIVDIISPPVMLVLMSLVSAAGSVLFFLSVQCFGSVPLYVASMIIYGGAMTLSRVPMQKIAAVLFEGPYISTAMAVNHAFSHVASLASNQLTKLMTPQWGAGATIQAYCIIGVFTLPICCVLYGLYTQRMSVKSGKKQGNLGQMLGRLWAETNGLYWLILLAGGMIDAHTILLKNMESKVSKTLDFAQDTSNNISMSGKVVLLLGPLFALLVDTFPLRQWYLLLGAGNKLALSLFIYWQYKDGGDNRKPAYWYAFKIMDGAFGSLFYSAFYSFFGIFLPKEIKGVGMGVNQSLLAVTPFFGPMIINWLDLQFGALTGVLMVWSVVAIVLSVIIIVVNYRCDDMINTVPKEEDRKGKVPAGRRSK